MFLIDNVKSANVENYNDVSKTKLKVGDIVKNNELGKLGILMQSIEGEADYLEYYDSGIVAISTVAQGRKVVRRISDEEVAKIRNKILKSRRIYEKIMSKSDDGVRPNNFK